MKFASRSAMPSESSAKAGSREAIVDVVLMRAAAVREDERRELREGGRRGVVGCGGGWVVE